MPLAAWLASLVPGLVARVLAAIGFGLVTITGLQLVTGQLLDYVTSSYDGIPGAVLGLMNLAGVGMAMNIILGAITARVALYVLTKSTRIIGG